MRDRRGAGDQEDVRGAAKEPPERDLHRRGAEAVSDVGQDRRLQLGESAERKERHMRDTVADERSPRVNVPARSVMDMIDLLSIPQTFRLQSSAPRRYRLPGCSSASKRAVGAVVTAGDPPPVHDPERGIDAHASATATISG